QPLLILRWCRVACILALAVLVGAQTHLLGQSPLVEDRPTPYTPLKPPTRKEIDRRDSLKQYVLGLLLERADQLLDALKAFEEAARLDPDAPAVFKAQASILLTLGREKDAMAAVGKVLDIDPGDREMWFVAARLHKSAGNDRQARRALERGLALPGLDERPEM